MTTRIPPPAIALAAALVQRALAGERRPASRARSTAATATALASMAMAGGAASRFRRSGTTVEPFHPDRASTLVTSGPNVLSRNPMYVGMAGVLLTHALYRGSWTALLPVAGFVAYIDRVQVRAEEAALREKFGPAYEAYLKSTPRWLDRRSLPLG